MIDARSGKEMAVGDAVDYSDGESIVLLEVDPGILRARARVRRVISTWPAGVMTREDWVPLQVRWAHPSFFLRHVAFIPS